PLDGANVLPMMEGKPVARAVPLFWQYDKAQPGPWTLALRQGDWKLLADAKQEKVALYNLATDIGETTDLAEKQPNRVRELRSPRRRNLAPSVGRRPTGRGSDRPRTNHRRRGGPRSPLRTSAFSANGRRAGRSPSSDSATRVGCRAA